jgi:plasmid stabilization system protein ParE
VDKEKSFSNSNCENQVRMAERELSAFIRAVTELFGPEQARLSTEDWLDEAELMDSPPRATSRGWRAVTIAASIRLAHRLAITQHRGSDRRIGASIRRFLREGFAARRAG